MKKAVFMTLLFSLTIIFSACSSEGDKAKDIYEKIHSKYYDVGSYSAECVVTSYTIGSENSYEVQIIYDKSTNSHRVVSEDTVMEIYEDKTVVSRGETVIETESEPTDMPYFPEMFFVSYYESENAAMSVSAPSDSDSILLECEAVNSTKINSHMKLWIDKKTVKPQKLQIFDDNDTMHTQVEFKSFSFDS